jgi:hypothetical protein
MTLYAIIPFSKLIFAIVVARQTFVVKEIRTFFFYRMVRVVTGDAIHFRIGKAGTLFESVNMRRHDKGIIVFISRHEDGHNI